MGGKLSNIFLDGQVTGFTPDMDGDFFKVLDYVRDHNYMQAKILEALKALSSTPDEDFIILYGGQVTDSGSGQIDIAAGAAIGQDADGNVRLVTIPELTDISLPSGWNDDRQIWVIGRHDWKYGTETRTHDETTETYNYTIEDSYEGESASDDLFVDSDPNTTESVVCWGSFQMSSGNVFTDLSSGERTREYELATYVETDEMSTDTIVEKTTDAGVTIDGVLLKDNDVEADEVRADEINEKTTDAGVTIEGVNIKDGIINQSALQWNLDSNTWTYSSADAPTYIFNVSGDATGYLYVGQKIKYTQDATTKYGIITAIGSYSGGITPITIYGGGNTSSPSCAMSANAITDPYFASTWRPFDFPMNPDTWSYIVADTTARTQSSPSADTWYNLGSISINIPIGLWKVKYDVLLEVSQGSSTGSKYVYATLSTGSSSESDLELTAGLLSYVGVAGYYTGNNLSRKKILDLSSKTTYYLNSKVNQSSTTLANANNVSTLVIKAVCKYL